MNVSRQNATLSMAMSSLSSLSSPTSAATPSTSMPSSTEQELREIMDNMINEFNNRFEMFAEEISTLKNIVLTLQSYVMSEVNIKLLEMKTMLTEINENVNFVNYPNASATDAATDAVVSTTSVVPIEDGNSCSSSMIDVVEDAVLDASMVSSSSAIEVGDNTDNKDSNDDDSDSREPKE